MYLTSIPYRRRLVLALFWPALFALALGPSARGEPARGTPYIRAYALDEIGRAPRSARIGFDSFGRFAVMYDGVYTVLNDTVWVDRLDPTSPDRMLMQTIRADRGQYFFGGRGAWGIAEASWDGHLRARSLTPADAPTWTANASLNEIVIAGNSVILFDLHGLVLWDTSQQRNHFFEIPLLRTAFNVGARIFASTQTGELREIRPHTDTQPVLAVEGLSGSVVERALPLSDTQTLLALQDRRLVLFDGHSVTPWAHPASQISGARILALTALAEGGVAMSVADQGLLIFAPDGRLLWRLSQPELSRVDSLTANEPGVVWAKGENAIYKVFYHSPMTSFGQAQGLSASWPRLALWTDKLVVCSGRTLYEHLPGSEGEPSRFKPMPGWPAGQLGAMAANGPHLLAADLEAIYALGSDGKKSEIGRLRNVSKIVFLGPTTCVALGSQESALFEFSQGQWTEAAARTHGVGDGPVRTLTKKSIWIELGGNSVGRVTAERGRLTFEQISLPWSAASWTNLGAIGSTIIFSGANGNRAYYDEDSQSFCEKPQLDALLNRSPFWIARITEGENGVIWATHSRGIIKYSPGQSDYHLDTVRFELRNDSYPEVAVLPDRSVWVSCSRALYKIEADDETQASSSRPILVSVSPDPRQADKVDDNLRPPSPLSFSYQHQNLSFRFFSGTYAWQSPPLYEYRLGDTESWTPLDSSRMLRFPQLREGTYALDVRKLDRPKTETAALALAFHIAPPWYRTPWAYLGWVALLSFSLLGLARWLHRRALQRNAELEALVSQRTEQLESTMARLNEETRNAATLAERSRVAAEIHDSLQQGISGTLIHLETTLAHPSLSPEVKAHLGVMRKMLSYSREEVQHAVWNLESPLLQNSTLDQALLHLVEFIRSGSVDVEVKVPSIPVNLAPSVQHNLLRIAQEALTNAVKHAQASTIRLNLQVDGEDVLLSVEDNGRGFDASNRQRRDGHLGLRGMEARARAIQGVLQIKSGAETGTIVAIVVQAAPQIL